MAQQTTAPSGQRAFILGLLAIISAVLVCHGKTLFFGYIWEDANTFLDPSPLQELRNLPGLFLASAHQGFSVSHTTPYYRPMTFLSWGLEYALFGPSPFWNHLSNLVIHSATAASIFAIGRRLVPATPVPALIAGLLFAVHPACIEAVSYIAARGDILCGLFMGWSFWAYLRFRQENNWRFLVIGQLLLAGALLSKEMALMMPALVLFFELGTVRRRNLLYPLIPTAVSLLYLLVRSQILIVRTWTDTPLMERLYTGIYVVGKYLLILIAPIDIRTFYDVTTKFSLQQPDVLLMLAVTTGYLFLSAIAWWRDQRLLATLMLAVPVLMFPASNIPAMIIPSPMAARYLYVPAMAFCLAAGLLLAKVQVALSGIIRDKGLPGPLQVVPSALLVTVLALLTVITNGKWRNNDAFFAAMLTEAPNQPMSYKLAGNYLGKTGRGDEMARLYQQAYEVTKRRQMALAGELIRFGRIERAAFELERIMSAENDPRIRQLMESIAAARKKGS